MQALLKVGEKKDTDIRKSVKRGDENEDCLVSHGA